MRPVAYQKLTAEASRRIAPVISRIRAAEGMPVHQITADVREHRWKPWEPLIKGFSGSSVLCGDPTTVWTGVPTRLRASPDAGPDSAGDALAPDRTGDDEYNFGFSRVCNGS